MRRGDKKNIIIISMVVVILICAIVATVIIVLNSTKNEANTKKQNNLSAEDNQNVPVNNTESGGYIDVGNEVEDDEKDDDETQNNFNSFEVQIFNVQFTVYEGEISGVQFGSLINTAIASNEKNPEHQVNPTSNNLESFANIDEEETYVVTLSYDDEGYVISINIDLKEDEQSLNNMNNVVQDVQNHVYNMAIQTFNAQFTAYEGKCTGTQVESVIEVVGISNVANPEHQVTINITKDDVKRSNKYRVEAEYGDDGYINKINVTKVDEEAN